MSASLDDLATNGKLIITQLGSIYSALVNIFRNTGTLTLAAAATTTVTNTAVAATSRVLLIPTNAAAATLVGSTKSPYVSTVTAGASFVVSTASGVAAAGTETFFYVVITPV